MDCVEAGAFECTKRVGDCERCTIEFLVLFSFIGWLKNFYIFFVCVVQNKPLTVIVVTSMRLGVASSSFFSSLQLITCLSLVSTSIA